VGSPGLTVGHLVILLLIVYNLAKGRHALVVFCFAYYLLTIAPVLFLGQHTFYLHNYIPAFGMILLLAPVVEDLDGLLEQQSSRQSRIIAGVLVGFVAVMCISKIRANESNNLRKDILLPKNFVLRRAIIAKNAYDDIKRKTNTTSGKDRLFMIYRERSSWYKDNVVAALGKGSALKLFYSSPDLDVFFKDQGDTLQDYRPAGSQILFFDHMGHCYTSDEMRGTHGDALRIIEPE
jgi:hypothetical protein